MKIVINVFTGLMVLTFSSILLAESPQVADSTQVIDGAQGIDHSQLTVEELRIKKAYKKMPKVALRFTPLLMKFEGALKQAKTSKDFAKVVSQYGQSLWRASIKSYTNQKDYDDRPLYWGRLQLIAKLRQAKHFENLKSFEQQQLIWQAELLTRGQADIDFDKNTHFKILLTGFDPFFLDRNLDQSNPSGVVAMAFDNKVLSYQNLTVEIETVIVPVRFADFDQGMIEELLTPYVKAKNIDMLVTVSMGRDDFDLERFPGLRRSAKAPDNLNILTGASAENPMIPLLNGKPLSGPEFNLFSLPVDVMKTAEGEFKINDNHKVTTTEKSYEPATLQELAGKTSVQGSGGGYLSNEISYRSLLIRDQYHPSLPVGHIHTPRFQGFEPAKIKKIVEQVENMLKKAIPAL